jgi:hypothetical protein
MFCNGNGHHTLDCPVIARYANPVGHVWFAFWLGRAADCPSCSNAMLLYWAGVQLKIMESPIGNP